jgi:hypothetical protein
LAFGILFWILFKLIKLSFIDYANSSNTEKIVSNPVLAQKTVYSILFSIAFAHLLNDLMQSVIPASYPILKDNFNLSFTQIGLITFVYQLTASLLQPFIGLYDKKPKPYSLVIGCFSRYLAWLYCRLQRISGWFWQQCH